MKRVGIDTNVLLRLIVNDNPEERQLVTSFGAKLNQEYRGIVTLVSLIEMDWALRSQYGFDRRQSTAAIRKITQIRGVEVECHDVVARALLVVDAESADLADALISGRAADLDCEWTVTLDRKAAKKIPGMELLA
jgi:predicted nucleic-acid-binding protein